MSINSLPFPSLSAGTARGMCRDRLCACDDGMRKRGRMRWMWMGWMDGRHRAALGFKLL